MIFVPSASLVSKDGRMAFIFIELDSKCVRGFHPILQLRKLRVKGGK